MYQSHENSSNKMEKRNEELQTILKNICIKINIDGQLSNIFSSQSNSQYLISRYQQDQLILDRVKQIIEDEFSNSNELKIQDLTQENLGYLKEIQKLTTQIKEMQISGYKVQGEQKGQDYYWKNEYMTLKQRYDLISYDYQNNLAQSQADIENLERKLSYLQENLEHKSTEIERLQNMNQQLQVSQQNEDSKLQMENEELNRQLQLVYEKELPELEQSNKALVSKVEQLSEVNQKQTKEFDRMLGDVQDAYEQKLMDLQTELDSMQLKKVEFEAASEANEQLKSEVEKLHQQIDELETELKKNQKQEQAQQKLAQMEREMKKAKRNNQQLTEEVQQSKSIIEKEQQEKLRLSTQLKNLQSDLSKSQQANKKLNDKINRIKSARKRQMEELSTRLKQAFRSIFSSIQLEKESIKMTICQLLEEFQESIMQFLFTSLEHIQSFQQEYTINNDQLNEKEWYEKSEVLKTELQQHFQQNKEKLEQHFLGQIQELQFKLSQKETQQQSEYSQITQQMNQISEENMKLDSLISQLQKEIQRQRQMVQDKEDIIEQQQNMNRELQEELVLRRQENSELVQEKQELRDIIGQLEDSLECKNKQIEELDQDCKMILEEKEQMKEDIQIILAQQQDTDQMWKLESQRQKELELGNRKLQKEVEYYREKIDQEQEKVVRLEKELESVRKDKYKFESSNAKSHKELSTQLDFFPSKGYDDYNKQTWGTHYGREYSMIVAKYKYERYSQNAETKHKQRMEYLKGTYQ